MAYDNDGDGIDPDQGHLPVVVKRKTMLHMRIARDGDKKKID